MAGYIDPSKTQKARLELLFLLNISPTSEMTTIVPPSDDATLGSTSFTTGDVYRESERLNVSVPSIMSWKLVVSKEAPFASMLGARHWTNKGEINFAVDVTRLFSFSPPKRQEKEELAWKF